MFSPKHGGEINNNERKVERFFWGVGEQGDSKRERKKVRVLGFENDQLMLIHAWNCQTKQVILNN